VLRGNMEARFKVLDEHLSSHDYLVGDDFTVADSYLFAIIRWCGTFKIDLGPWPSLKAHFERIGERPHVQAAMKAEGLT